MSANISKEESMPFAEIEVTPDEIIIRRGLSQSLRDEAINVVRQTLTAIANDLESDLARQRGDEMTGEQAYRWAIDSMTGAIRRACSKVHL